MTNTAELRYFPDKRAQTVRGFGASGAWWAQMVGGWDEADPASGESVRDRICELLYSREKGLGLTIYRYNLGSGSARDGSGAKMGSERTAESFLRNGFYDWDSDKNAVYMMRQAQNDGADEFVFFCNSAPLTLTANGLDHGSTPCAENLPPENYRAFARYVLDVSEHFIGEGIKVRYVSPVNEPQWAWNGGQEGCHFEPGSLGRLYSAFAAELEDRCVTAAHVKLAGPESGDVRVRTLAYICAMLSDRHVRRFLDAADVHSYFSGEAGKRWFMLRKKFLCPDLPVRMSEWTHMKGGRDASMASALEQAKVMWQDLTIMDAVSWQHWIAVSPYDFCDGLIYVDPQTHAWSLTKRYFAFGNFTKFVTPGMVRIRTSCADRELLTLGFKSGDTTVLIAINSTKETHDVKIAGSGHCEMYTTDETGDLRHSLTLSPDLIALTPRSVNTIVLQN